MSHFFQTSGLEIFLLFSIRHAFQKFISCANKINYTPTDLMKYFSLSINQSLSRYKRVNEFYFLLISKIPKHFILCVCDIFCQNFQCRCKNRIRKEDDLIVRITSHASFILFGQYNFIFALFLRFSSFLLYCATALHLLFRFHRASRTKTKINECNNFFFVLFLFFSFFWDIDAREENRSEKKINVIKELWGKKRECTSYFRVSRGRTYCSCKTHFFDKFFLYTSEH